MPEPPQRPAIASSPLSLVLIARRDVTAARPMQAAWETVLRKRKQPYEIIVVVDEPEAQADGASNWANTGASPVKMEPLQTGRGFGAALRAGIALAQYPLLAYCTADGQYQAADLEPMLKLIDQVDVVTGYRVGARAPRWLRVSGALTRLAARVALGIPLEANPTWRGWAGAPRRWLLRWVFGVFVHDAECAFRLFRRDFLARIPIQSDGTFAHTEILAKANFMGGFIGQVAVSHRQPPAAATSEGVGLEAPSWKEIRQVFGQPSFAPGSASPAHPEQQTTAVSPPQSSVPPA